MWNELPYAAIACVFVLVNRTVKNVIKHKGGNNFLSEELECLICSNFINAYNDMIQRKDYRL